MTVTSALLALIAAAALALAWYWRRQAQAARRDRDAARAAETEARAATMEARAAEDEAHAATRRAVRARESFFDLATHELRSPLAAILGYQELLQDGAYGGMDEATAEPVERIGNSARHLLHLIDGVVELSRLRGGGVQPDIEPVNLNVLLSGVADAFRTRARERRIEPVVHVPGELPTAATDLDRLLRALDLMVTSAIKHPHDDTLRMDVATDQDHALSVTISPTSIEPRQEADDPDMRLGIRLAIVRAIAELLGGGLHAEGDDAGVIHTLRFEIGPGSGTPSDRFDDAARGG